MSFNYFTGLNIAPTSEWTMDLKGAKQIRMVGFGDKRHNELNIGMLDFF
jgi:hypothetical protein